MRPEAQPEAPIARQPGTAFGTVLPSLLCAKEVATTQGQVVACEDVRGWASLLAGELAKHDETGAELVFLGELIDSSPEPGEDRSVVERVMSLQQQTPRWDLSNLIELRGWLKRPLAGSYGLVRRNIVA